MMKRDAGMQTWIVGLPGVLVDLYNWQKTQWH
jgi:hypothetical protein